MSSDQAGAAAGAWHPNVARVQAALERAGLPTSVHRFPEGTRTAADAARAVGTDVGAIVKSLVFMAGDEPVLVLTSGANRVDTAALSRHLGKAVRRADADEVRAVTGFPIGGVPPLGHPRPLRALADPALMDYHEVWAAAGTPDGVFPVEPEALIRASGATFAPAEVFVPQGTAAG